MRDRRRGESGFTVVELVVTMALLSIALAIAAGLMVEAVRIFSATGRELREPASELTLRLLREDVRASAPVTISTPGVLDCRRADRTDQWRLSGETLERRSFDLSGNDLGARPMLDHLVTFHLRLLAPGLVEVEIVRRIPAAASALRAATSAWRSDGEALESATIVAGSRIGGS
jgi:prepilin-type N-terminal cleavage/methylation domain-containing protein